MTLKTLKNDIDLQEVNEKYDDNTLFSTWCIDSFFFEMLSEATFDMGTHEKIDFEEYCTNIEWVNPLHSRYYAIGMGEN